jgi:hypothetical protein
MFIQILVIKTDSTTAVLVLHDARQLLSQTPATWPPSIDAERVWN